MRSGKSYFLGHLLRHLSDPENDDWFNKKLNKGFHWKNSAERQTTGILMWSEPFFITRNRKKIAVVLIDTQGCFDEQTTGQENSAIFALSCLLSSVLIYNVRNLLTEDAFQNLQMFIGYAKFPKDFSRSESNDPESFSNLVFLIRDWEFPNDYDFGYYDDITSSGSKNFKKEKVDPTDRTHPVNVTVRNEILKSFENVGCCLMPYPGVKLARYDKEDDLDPDFITTIKNFVPRIFEASNICLKKIDGREISGVDFKQYVQNLADCFRQYTFPTVENAAEAQAKFQNQKAQSIAILYYREKMNNEMKSKEGLSEEKFEIVHTETKSEAIDAFNMQPRIRLDYIQSQ
jgi:atlastin